VKQEGTLKSATNLDVTIIDYKMVMKKENSKDIYSMDNCPIRNVLNRIGDKWSILIIDLLGSYGTLRFNELNHHIGSISQKMLTVTLKMLEADGLVTRKLYPQIPPKVEYTLTEMGKSMLPSVAMLKDWASENMPAILKSRAQYSNQGHLETDKKPD